ncbi:MAG TPA: hypothetical protein VF795_06660 [Desulfuromonadaceae bacterium]
MSITLHKDGSGTWSAQGKTKGLKAWQRLWIVACITHLLLIIAAGYLLMPTRERIEREMVFAVTGEVGKYEGMVFAGDPPEKIFETARSQGYGAWIAGLRKRYRIGAEGDAGFDRIERNYRRDMEGLTRKRLRLSAWLAVAWLAPMGALYLMGWTVDWINRGTG